MSPLAVRWRKDAGPLPQRLTSQKDSLPFFLKEVTPGGMFDGRRFRAWAGLIRLARIIRVFFSLSVSDSWL